MFEVLHLDKIRPSSDNVRRVVDDLDELKASIVAIGLQQPLVVRPTKNAGVYDLTAGHRRYAALAELGHETAECVVRTVDGPVGHVVAMLVENLMRKDLSPLEEAYAIQRLIDEGGLTQEGVAERVGRAQPTISKRLALLRLPARFLAEVDSGGIPLAAALKLARLVDHPKRMDAAWDQVRRYDSTWDDAIDAETTELDEDLAVEAATADLKAKGVKVVEHPRYGWYDSKAKPLGRGYNEVNVGEAKHAKERCHAAAVARTGKVVFVCTNPAAHKKPAAKAALSPQQAAQREEDRRRKADAKELKEAAQVRRIAIGDLVAKKPTKLDDRAVFVARQLISSLREPRLELTIAFLRIAPTGAASTDSREKALRAYLDKGAEFVARAALAAAFAVAESGLADTWTKWGVRERDHLAYLQRHAGYHLAEVERRKLGAAGVQLELPAGKAAAKRRTTPPAAVVDLAAGRRGRKPVAAVG